MYLLFGIGIIPTQYYCKYLYYIEGRLCNTHKHIIYIKKKKKYFTHDLYILYIGTRCK